ncbi:hypothetical protein BN1708_006438 [Verticillium longisporum]|uniref:Uncharacterized protein n=1 Tax=Verticillium longisporum TaxID=100787 RepID=A0A0G4MKA3_VERLO|nr:hypothetical protein BN1708_006438 [Verticillium longisporum]
MLPHASWLSKTEVKLAPEALDSVECYSAAELDAVPAGLPVSYSRSDVDQLALELVETELVEKAGAEDGWDDLILRKDKRRRRGSRDRCCPRDST